MNHPVDYAQHSRAAALRAYLLGIAACKGVVPFVYIVQSNAAVRDLRALLVSAAMNGEPPITAIVISRSTGMAPNGFFEVMQKIGKFDPEKQSREEFWKACVAEVHAAYSIEAFLARKVEESAPDAAAAVSSNDENLN